MAPNLGGNAQWRDHNFYDDSYDWVKIDAIAGNYYLMQSYTFGIADTIMNLIDNRGNLYAENDDWFSGYKGSRISWRCPKTGRYFLQVRSKNGSGGNRNYELYVC